MLLATSAYSESSYAKVQSGAYNEDYTYPSTHLNERIETHANALNIPLRKGVIHSSDVFYRENFEDYKTIYKDHNAIAVEMESFALFHNAKVTGKNAACILTVSDSLVTKEATSALERQNAFTKMMEIALSLAE